MQKSNKDTMRAFFNAAAKNNNEQMLAILHSDIKIIEAESLPYGGITEGRKNFKGFTKKVFTTWRDTEITVEELIGDGNYVVVLATMSGKSKSSGSLFSMSIAEVWKFDSDGKAIEIKPFYFDTNKLVEIFNGDT
jgi:ketosteroid isomerase-like protein